MKISLCRRTKEVEKIAKFLDRNLHKVKIEIKDCIGMCDDCEKKVVAKIDGEKISAKDAYGLLKEVRKVLKKADKLELLDEEEMKRAKKERKEEKDGDKDARKKKDRDKEQKKSDKNKSGSQQPVPELSGSGGKPQAQGIGIALEGSELILTITDGNFSPDDLRVTVHYASEAGRSERFRISREEATEDALSRKSRERETDKAAVLAFSTPQFLGSSAALPEIPASARPESLAPDEDLSEQATDEGEKEPVQPEQETAATSQIQPHPPEPVDPADVAQEPFSAENIEEPFPAPSDEPDKAQTQDEGEAAGLTEDMAKTGAGELKDTTDAPDNSSGDAWEAAAREMEDKEAQDEKTPEYSEDYRAEDDL